MTIPLLQGRKAEAFFALSALGLVLTLAVLSTIAAPPTRPDLLDLGVTLDLVLGLPLLGYLFLVRSGRGSWWIALPLAGAGFIVSRIVVGGAGPLTWETVLIAVEGAALLALGVRVLRIRRRYTELLSEATHPSDAALLAFEAGLGPTLGGIAYGEASVLWYAVRGWRRKSTPTPGTIDALPPRGHGAIVGALTLLIVVETVALHLILHLWDPRVAWILTLASVYGIVWLVGDLNAARRAPTRLDARGLHLRAGLRWRADVPWGEIVGVGASEPRDASTLSTAFLRPPDLWIEFREPLPISGPFGLSRRCRAVGLAVEDTVAFRSWVDRFLADERPGSPQVQTW